MTDFFALLVLIGPMAAVEAMMSGILLPGALACGIFAMTPRASPLRTAIFGAVCLLVTAGLSASDLETVAFGFFAYAIPFILLVLPLIALLGMLKRFDLFLSTREQGSAE